MGEGITINNSRRFCPCLISVVFFSPAATHSFVVMYTVKSVA